MSLLNSKFDLVSVDNPVALAALAQVLSVSSPPSPTLNANGTPVAGTIFPGAVVKMDSSGKAVLATTPDLSADPKVLPFIAIDGNVDYSGAWTQRLTVLQGGFTMKTDQYDPDPPYVAGDALTFSGGKLTKKVSADQQGYGWVGPEGEDTVNGVLHVIVPQGA